VAVDLNNLAHLYHATNRLAEAEPLMRRALAMASREAAYRNLDAAAGKADAEAAGSARTAIARIEARLAEKQAQLRKDFPNYAELVNPKPLSLPYAQALLGERQALVLFLDLWQIGKVPEETIVFVLTKKEARWTSIPLGTGALKERVTALRCGLDSTNWRFGESSREVCKRLLSAEASEDELPPFDARAAHALYNELFGGVKDLIREKSLLIVPRADAAALRGAYHLKAGRGIAALRDLQNSGVARASSGDYDSAFRREPQGAEHRQKQHRDGAVHWLR
jgi:hypothetical protein